VKEGEPTLKGKRMLVGELPEGYYEVTFFDLSRPCFSHGEAQEVM